MPTSPKSIFFYPRPEVRAWYDKLTGNKTLALNQMILRGLGMPIDKEADEVRRRLDRIEKLLKIKKPTEEP